MKVKKVLKSNKFIFNSYCKLMHEIFLFKVWLSKFSNVYRKSTPKMAMLKNQYLGKRCFVIGNGPSLTPRDLDKLTNEYTFATNMIYKIYNKTLWRPTYYIAQDYVALEYLYNDSVNKLSTDEIFLPIDIKYINIKYTSDNIYFYLYRRNPFPKIPKFSNDASKVIYEGGSVTYTAIQMAVYMGFTEIYLLGVDHNYNKVISDNGEIFIDKSVNNYFSENYSPKQNDLPVNLILPTLAYQSAKEYCEKHNVKIYNATRGGKLETFERVNFEELKFILP